MDAAFFSLESCGVAEIDPPHPSPLPQGARGKGSRSRCIIKARFDSRFQVGVTRTFNPPESLSLAQREREPIGECSKPAFNSRLSGRCNSNIHLGRLPLPPGEGWGEGKAFYLLGCLACSSLAAARCFSSAGSIFCAKAFSSGAPLTLSSVTVLACFLNSSMVSSCAFT